MPFAAAAVLHQLHFIPLASVARTFAACLISPVRLSHPLSCVNPSPDTWCTYLVSSLTSSRCHLALFQPVYLLVAHLVAALVVPRLARVYLAARGVAFVHPSRTFLPIDDSQFILDSLMYWYRYSYRYEYPA